MPKARILIAEDEAIVALDVKSRLERLGYSVPAVVDSGEEAVRVTLECRPDLVLMDIRLKGTMDGIEAVEAIQAELAVPVVYITALSDRETRQRAEMSELCAYITKPIDRDELQTVVERALDRHGAEPESLRNGTGRAGG